MTYQEHRQPNETRSAFVRRAILGLAALATCWVVYFHVRATEAAGRAESFGYYDRRICDLDQQIQSARFDADLEKEDIENSREYLKLATTAKEELDEKDEMSKHERKLDEIKNRIADLERERRQLRDAIHRVKTRE